MVEEKSVIIFIASQGHTITEAFVQEIATLCEQHNISVKIERKSPVILEYAYLSENSKASFGALLKEKAKIHHYDSAYFPKGKKNIKLFMADMDSTMIMQECIDELADFAGKKAEVSAITERAMAGALDFQESLIQRVACLKGLSTDILSQCIQERISFTAGGKELISALKNNNIYTVLVSGGFTFFAQFVADALGFDAFHANQLEIVDGHLTGSVNKPILDRNAKKIFMQDYIQKLNIQPENVMAIGDGANDLDMLNYAGTGIAFHAKEIVAQQADIALNFGDLSAVQYFYE